MSNNTTGEMPDLPIEQKSLEQRRVIKFWIDYCHSLEEKNRELREELAEFRKLLPDYKQKKVI
jgi:hypothetical protein